MKLAACDGGKYLGESVARILQTELLETETTYFQDGEIKISVGESFREQKIYLFQSFSKNVNTELLEVLFAADAMKRSAATKVNLVIPYFAYSRQDKQGDIREPISARVLARTFERNGIDRVMTMDLHTTQIQGFFDITCDHLTARGLLGNALRDRMQGQLENLVIVAPDVGGAKRARQFADELHLDLAIIEKMRNAAGVRALNLIGNVDGKTAVILDDLVSTGGTLIEAEKKLKEHGAQKVMACFTHALLSKGFEHLEQSNIDYFITTNTINQEIESAKLKIVDISQLVANAIYANETGGSMSMLA